MHFLQGRYHQGTLQSDRFLLVRSNFNSKQSIIVYDKMITHIVHMIPTYEYY
jgi:hypothetical protein